MNYVGRLGDTAHAEQNTGPLTASECLVPRTRLRVGIRPPYERVVAMPGFCRSRPPETAFWELFDRSGQIVDRSERGSKERTVPNRGRDRHRISPPQVGIAPGDWVVRSRLAFCARRATLRSGSH
jgi:hypothetical protein